MGKTVFTKKATFDWSQQRYSETFIGAFDLVLLVRLRSRIPRWEFPERRADFYQRLKAQIPS